MAAESSVPVRAPRWGVGETHALLDAWTPLHQRRRRAQGDPWVPLHQRRRSSLDLVDEDWRAVAVAVNNDRRVRAGSRADRTGAQCKRRMGYLKRYYKWELAKKKPSRWKFFGVLDAIFGGDERLRPTRQAMRLEQPEPELAKKQSEPSGSNAAVAQDDGGEAGAASTRAEPPRRDATRGTFVAAVLMKLSDVLIKWLEVDEAEAARGSAEEVARGTAE